MRDPLGLRADDDSLNGPMRPPNVDVWNTPLLYSLSWPLFSGTFADAHDVIEGLRSRPNDFFPFSVELSECASDCAVPIALGNVLVLEASNYDPGPVRVIEESYFSFAFLALPGHIAEGGTVRFTVIPRLDPETDPFFSFLLYLENRERVIDLNVTARSGVRGIENAAPPWVSEFAGRLTWSIMVGEIRREWAFGRFGG